MNTSKKGSKRTLALISGLLFVSLVINSIEELKPSQVISVDQATTITEEVNTEEIIETVPTESTEIKQKVVEENVSKKAKDTAFERKVNKVKTYLKSRRSPLANYANELVKAADTYGIDYRLVASISIIESSGGKHNFRPYNAWGWGKSGFSNWKEGIWAVSKGLGKYYSRGLNTPKKIAPVYCPPNAVKWGNNVQYIMNQIGK